MVDVSEHGKFRKQGLKGKTQLDDNNDRLLVTDESNYRLLAGLDNNGDVVVKVSKPGFNVLDATDTQLIFNSSQNIFKIVQTGTVSLAVSQLTVTTVGVQPSTSSTQVAHNLGYPPLVIAFNDAGGGFYYAQNNTVSVLQGASGSYRGETRLEAFVDANNVYFNAATVIWMFSTAFGNAVMPAQTLNIRYYLLQETAN